MPKRKRNNDRRSAARVRRGRRRPGLKLAAIAAGILFFGVLGVAVMLPQLRPHSADALSDAEDTGSTTTLPYEVPARPASLAGSSSSDQARISQLRDQSFDVAERVVAAFPNSADAVCLLATVHHRHTNDVAALVLWNACLQLDSQCADARQMLGNAAMEKGDYQQAESHLREALAIDPNWTSIPPTLAEALAYQGKFREAAELLERHRQTVPQDPRAWCKLGEAYQHLEGFDKAKTCFQAALKLYPDSADACYGLAMTLNALGQDVAAEPYFVQFRNLKESQEQASRQLRPSFDDVWRMRTTLVVTHMTAARVYLRHGNADAAVQQCKLAAALDPEHRECREMLCSLYTSRQDLKSALRVRQELCQLAPDDPRQWLSLGILSYQAGRMAEAEKAFRRLIQLAPDQAEGYLTLAQILMAPAKNPREAVQLARKGIGLSPTAPNYHILATVCESVGDIGSAREALAKSLQLDPQNVKYQDAYRRLQHGQRK